MRKLDAADTADRTILTAEWVIPVDGPPLARGVVEIERGMITAVAAGPAPPGALNLGNAALIPGLVNCHMHLELSDVASPIVPGPVFTDWLKSVMEHRRARASATASEAATHAVDEGCRECLAQGTTLVADIVSPDWKAAAVSATPLPVLPLLECLGLSPERIAAQVQAAREYLTAASGEPQTSAWGRHSCLPSRDVPPSPSGEPPGTVRRGLSPHAPYSVHPDLLRDLVNIATQHQAPVAMHVAETAAERELLEAGRGPFVAFLKSLGVWRDDVFRGGLQLIETLRELARAPRALVVHGNDLTLGEIDFLAGCPHVAVVYCPRTHAWFKHPPHPWLQLIERGVGVAVGTDSRASNPDLSIWRELKFLHERHPSVAPSLLLALGTRDGARALGCDTLCGTLTPGKRADLAVVTLPPGPTTDPFARLFDDAARLSAVMVGGRWAVAPALRT